MFGLNAFGRVGAVVRSAFAAAADPDAVIKALFANSEQGAWFDYSDLTTMFQDRAGTTPVTADGQTVGKILDKSGRGNHATAPSDAARPLYKTSGGLHWLQFDGVDDALSTAAIDLTGVTYQDVFIGIEHTGGTLWADVWWTANIAAGYWAIGQSGNSSPPHVIGSTTYRSNGVDLILPTRNDIYNLCINKKVVQTSIDTTLVSGGGGLSVSGYSSALITGNIYSLIVLGRLAATQEITDTETWVNGKTGAY